MRLLFVHDRFGALAGAEVNVLLTATELQRRGHNISLVHGPCTGKDEQAWRDTFQRRLEFTSSDPVALLRSAIEAFSPEAIFVHKMSDLDVIEALSTCGVPVARMVHDHDLYCMRGYKYHYFSRQICTRAASPFCIFPCGASLARDPHSRFPLRWVGYLDKRREIELNRRFARMIVATDYMRDELLRNGFLPAQIETHAPVPMVADKKEPSSFDARNRIVYAGQIVRGKGVDILLEALALVTVPFECVILGDGNHRAYCERLSRTLGLADRVKFAGFVSQEKVAGFYRDASLAVMSSVWPEPFGAVGLEAMRHGLPVVAFDAGGIREWLIDGVTGYLAPWMDCARYAACVEIFLKDKALAREMGARGRQWVDQRFNFENYIRGLEEMFTRVTSASLAETVHP
ncbi:MAG: glycosyltransferase [Rariglobus sp.]|jgi:glycosyltransferase involved in cell wall biosynthesis|nr:glycosyltransferase [Rariglobus sp.]